MKTNLLTTVLAVGMLSSCSSSFFLTSNTTGEDDIYYNPEKKYVASVSGEDINPLNSKDPRVAELQRKMNDAMSDTVVTSDTMYVEETNANPYESVLVSSIDESRERRLKAQSDLSFSYNDYSDALFYASAYDPAFYNVVVYGSHVWVEPRWVSSSWYFPRSSFSLGFGSAYGAYWPGVSYGYGIFNPWGIGLYSGLYWGYNDYYDFHGYYYGRPANSNNYHFGRRGVSSSEYNKNVEGVNRYDNSYVGTRRRGTSEPRITNTTTTSNPNGDLDGSNLRRRPDTNPSEPKNMNQPNSRQRTGTTTVYTRPSTVNQKGGDGYTPTYTRPSGGVRQDYNSSRPASNGSSSYERRPATSSGSGNQNSGSSGNSYSRPTSNTSGSSYSRPATTSSGSSGNSNSGTSGGTRRR